MNDVQIKSIIERCVKQIAKASNGAERADIYVYLGIELGLSHLLMPDALPDINDDTPLPDMAPELYQKRNDRSEVPHEFILRVYHKWIGKGLVQNHILNLDKPLYFALHQWMKRNGMPEGFDLPSKKEMNDRALQDIGLEGGETLPFPSYYKGLKDKLRLYNAARNRAKKDE